MSDIFRDTLYRHARACKDVRILLTRTRYTAIGAVCCSSN